MVLSGTESPNARYHAGVIVSGLRRAEASCAAALGTEWASIQELLQ